MYSSVSPDCNHKVVTETYTFGDYYSIINNNILTYYYCIILIYYNIVLTYPDIVFDPEFML
jgi:hypothetical protein